MMKRNASSENSSSNDRLTRESLRREWGILRFAWKMAKRYHVLLLVLMLLELVLGVLPAVAIYYLQDAVSGAGHDILSIVTKENSLLVILFLAGFFLLQKSVSIITTFAIIDTEYNIRMKYLSKMLAIPIETISRKMDNRDAFGMTRETSMTSSLIPMVYNSFLRAPVAIISSIVLLVIISPRMVALVTLMIAVIVGINFLMRARLKQFNREQYNATSSLLQYFNEWLQGHRIYYVYGAEGYYKKKMTSTFDTISDVSKRHKLYGTLQSLLVEILTYIAIILFVVFLSDRNGSIDIGIALSFPALILLIRGEILKLVGGYQQLANTESSVTRLQTVLQPEAPSDEGLAWKEKIVSIELENLSYRYEAQDGMGEPVTILDHADLTLAKGRLNVITGPNGTGKSTTINLILGLLRPKDGDVLYNGKSIADYTLASRLREFAIVEQEPFVFQGSLKDNLTLGREIGDAVMKDYLHKFALDYLLDDTGGLSLAIGPKGRALSSGEKQRLALIRALVGNPSAIILDEPTSNIDSATATLIIDVMKDLAMQHLVVCVSHDTVLTADENLNLFWIKNGNYVQRGGK